MVREVGVREIILTVEREGREVRLPVTPEIQEDPETGEPYSRVGVIFRPPYRRVQAQSVSGAIGEAVAETARWGGLTVRQLGRLVGGGASVRQFSGPIRHRPGLRGSAPPGDRWMC